MPIPLLIALLIAFGMELPGDEVPGPSVSFRLIETLGGILLIAALSFGLGGWVAAQVSHLGYASGRVFRRYMRGSRILTVAGLAIYAWIIHLVGWPRLVLSNWGLQGLVLVDDLAVLLPVFRHPAHHLERPLPGRARSARRARISATADLSRTQGAAVGGAGFARGA